MNTKVCIKKSTNRTGILLAAAIAVGIAAQARAEECTLQRITELPMDSNEWGSPVISIQLDGTPRKFELDTGGFWSLLDPSVTGSFKSRRSPLQGRLGLDAIVLDKVVTVPSVQLDRFKFENVDFFEAPAAYIGVDGTLGANWLSNWDIEIDPVGRKVALFLPDHCTGKVVYWPHQDLAIVDLRMDPRSHWLTIPMTLDGYELRALVDTGAPDTTLSLQAAKRLFDLTPDSPGMIPSFSAMGRHGQHVRTWRYRFSLLEVDGIAFRNPMITIAERVGEAPDLVLGMHQMQGLHLYFAYKEHKLYATSAQGDIAARSAESGGDKIVAQTSQSSPVARINAQDFFRNAQAEMTKRDLQSAAADLDKAIAIDPTFAPAYAMRAGLYAAAGDRERAMQALDQAIAHDPGLVNAYVERSNIYEIAGDYPRAYADADRAVRAEPKSPVALNARCWIGAIMGRLGDALADCNAAVALAPKIPAILDSRAFVHLKAKQFDDAIKDYDAALAIDPKMAQSLYGRGLAKREKGDLTGGNADINAAEQATPGVADRFGK